MSIKIRPLHDKVVVRPLEDERTSAGGIVIPDTAAAEKPMKGEILAVGPGVTLENGDTRALTVKVGDKVLFGKYAGTEVKWNNDKLVVMKEDDIMAIVD